MLDLLHDELKLIYTLPESQNEGQTTIAIDDWKETGAKGSKMTFNNDINQQSQQSLISEIFGGVIRTEFNVEGSKNVSITLEPFFILNLEISKCEDVDYCLE